MGGNPIGQKEAYWQFLRGTAILLVVLTHCIPLEYAADLSGMSVWYFMEANLISTSVAIFFYISGYWAEKSCVRSADMRSFCLKRLKRLLVPYFIFSVAYVGFRMLLRETFSPGEIVTILLLGKAASPLYFVPVLLVFHC